MGNTYYNIGDNLKDIRMNKHLGQRFLANELGVSLSLFSNWENNTRSISAEHLNKLCFLLKCSRADLIGPDLSDTDKRKDILLSIFDNLTPDMQDLLLVRAKELESINKEILTIRKVA